MGMRYQYSRDKQFFENIIIEINLSDTMYSQ